jgi:hypothetical protein
MNEEAVMPELGTGVRVQEDCVKQEWRPTRMESLRNHNINIEFLSMGCIVRVGCMSIPFQFVNDAIDALKAYTENPYEEKQKWEKLIESRQ